MIDPEKIVDIFPEYVPENPSENLMNIRIRDLLTMRTGLENPLFFCDSPERYTTKDWIKAFFDASFSDVPGTYFRYSNFGTFMVSCAIEKKAGVNLLEYLRYRLFEPIGIGNPDWTLDPKGHVHAANGWYVTIDELARFGHLMLGMGEYNGKQLVPREYMLEATSTIVPQDFPGLKDCTGDRSIGYGYYFFRKPDGNSFSVDGNYGQYCITLPAKDAVVVVMSLEGGDRYNKIGDYLWRDLISKL